MEFSRQEIQIKMNEWGGQGIPYLFILDFEMVRCRIFPLNEIDPAELLYALPGMNNVPEMEKKIFPEITLEKTPISFEDYAEKFSVVMEGIERGDTFLTNLTCATPVHSTFSLQEIFYASKAKYKLWLRDHFTCFSPEIFVQIRDGKIHSYPMKGTIDAAIPGAEKRILEDPKEKAEHYTIVDLIRNDLSHVSKNVEVRKFRYLDKVVTPEKSLLQVSSEIMGELDSGYEQRMGDILFQMLPAGSVSGAPKQKTTEIIFAAEGEPRGYYTGVFGVFDGQTLDSAVMIRFIENTPQGRQYRSGGGITSFSQPKREYQEMIDKIYVPVA